MPRCFVTRLTLSNSIEVKRAHCVPQLLSRDGYTKNFLFRENGTRTTLGY